MVMKRLEYMDCLRGMVMLMVVFCHTCGEFSLGCKNVFWLSDIFGILMLPGFFFVSGWFTHIGISGGAILKRLETMLLPTVAMFLIYVFLYWGNMDELGYCALGEYKFGYWFTFALFLINLIHWIVEVGLKHISLGESKKEKWTSKLIRKIKVWYEHSIMLFFFKLLLALNKYLLDPFHLLRYAKGMQC